MKKRSLSVVSDPHLRSNLKNNMVKPRIMCCIGVLENANLKTKVRKKSIKDTITVSNSLDPDQARQNVGPDMHPNCLQRLSADNNGSF